MLRSSIPLRPIAVRGFDGLAVTPHYLSSEAAMSTLALGGTAIDAAIAANAVQGVVAPETCGIGGDLFALVAEPNTPQPHALNSSGRAGSGADQLSRRLRESGAIEIPQNHPCAVTVPGCVDGWMALHDRWGALDLAAVLESAVRLARDGFPANRELASAFAARRDQLASAPSLAGLYPGGRPPLEGERVQRPRLAATLQAIGEHGRDALYRGRVGAAISEAVDGVITGDDLAQTQSDWIEPLGMDLFGLRAWTIPPNSQGYISLLTMAVIERIGLADPEDPRYWHLAIEAYRLAAADHGEVLADPDRMEIPPSDLLADERVNELAARFSEKRRADLIDDHTASGGTAYLCVIDAGGLGVSLIQSNFHGIGSSRVVDEGGFVLHDRGRGFNLRSGHPNELAAGRRPLHTLSPTLWTDSNRLTGLLGTRGGFMQPQLVAQLATAIVGHRTPPERAMAAPRWMVPLPGQLGDGLVQVEPGTPREVVDGLRRTGHQVEVCEIPQSGWGPMSTIEVSEHGLRTGTADPRVDTASAAAR